MFSVLNKHLQVLRLMLDICRQMHDIPEIEEMHIFCPIFNPFGEHCVQRRAYRIPDKDYNNCQSANPNKVAHKLGIY